MKKVSILFCAALIAASTFVSSCKKDDTTPDTTTPPESKCYISKVKEDGKYTEQYIYNGSNKLETVNEFGADGSTVENHSQLTYDGSGRVVKFENFEGTDKTSYFTWEYNSDNTVSKFHYFAEDPDGGSELVEVIEIRNTYSGGVNTRADLYNVSSGTPSLFGYDEYTYSNGNLTKATSYSLNPDTQQGELNSTVVYTYDTKKNPYANMLNLPTYFSGGMMSKNNQLSATYTNADGAVTETDTYVYEYANSGYATKITETVTPASSTPTTSTTELEMLCK